MATSGTIKLTWAGEGNSGGYEARVKWSSSTNTSTFKSTVSFSVQVRRNSDNSAYNTATYDGWIDFFNEWTETVSEFVINKGITINPYDKSWHTLTSGSFTVSHSKSSGKAPPIYVDGLFDGTNTTGFYVARGTIIQLTAIPVSVGISSAPNFTDAEGDNPTITYSVKSPSATTALAACISFDGTKDDIPYRDIDKNSSSYTFELTEEEREILRLGTLNGKNTRTVYFYIRSTVNGNTSTNKLGKTLTIVDAEPTMTEPAVIDMNDDTFALTKDRNTFIKGYSMAACQTHARPQKNADIVSYKFVNGSKVEERDEDLCAIPEVESDTFELSATDNRGLTTTKTLTRTLIEYTKPTCIQETEIEIDPDVPSADRARIAITISGEFFNSTFGDAEGAVKNTPNVQIRHKIGEGEYSEWTSVSSIIWETYTDGNTYRTSGNLSDLPYDKIITVQSRVVDSLESATTAEYPLKLDPVFHWSEDDFVFNVPVKFNAGFTSGDSTGDYVIETGTYKMGTNGTWYWRKWSSGRADCYGVRNFGNMGVSTAWGSLYRSAIFTQDLPKYEDGSNIFKSAPEVITIDFSHGGMSAWVVKHEQTAPGADTTGSFMVVRAASATLSQVYLDFNIIGRWK